MIGKAQDNTTHNDIAICRCRADNTLLHVRLEVT
jgi:hypothetical protein